MKEKLIYIQEENRKFILEANYGIKEKILENPNFSAEIWKDYSCLPITLPRVLLALPKKTKKNKYLEFLIGERDCEAIGDEEWFDGYKKCFIATVVACHCCKDFWTDVFIWKLEFEMLEEQSEKTQRAIHRILVGDGND